MEFLMILSALLSAVTGAFAGPRPAEARLHQESAAQSVAAARPSAAIPAPATRPAAPLAARPAPVVHERRPAPLPLASAPVGTDRLIE